MTSKHRLCRIGIVVLIFTAMLVFLFYPRTGQDKFVTSYIDSLMQTNSTDENRMYEVYYSYTGNDGIPGTFVANVWDMHDVPTNYYGTWEERAIDQIQQMANEENIMLPDNFSKDFICLEVVK